MPCYTGTCPLSHMFVAAKHGFGVQGRSLQARGRTQRQPCFVWCQMPVPVPVQVGRRSQVCRRPVQRCTKQQSACLLLLVSLPPVALRKHAYKLVLPALLVVGGGGGRGGGSSWVLAALSHFRHHRHSLLVVHPLQLAWHFV